MRKYIGQYRISCEFDRATLQPNKDDLHIVCYKNSQIYRVDGNTLAYYRASRGYDKQICENLKELGVKGIENRSTDGDILIYFDESCLDIVVSELGVVTSGASISPWSVKNLRKLDWFKENKQLYIDKGLYKELSEEEKEVYRERFKNILQK